MTPEADLTEAARLIEEQARQAMDDDRTGAVLLYALARRLRQHAKQTELKDCRQALQRAVQQVRDCQEQVVQLGGTLGAQPGRAHPTPPPLAPAGR